MVFSVLTDSPKSQSGWGDPNDEAHPLGPSVQLPMPQEPKDILSYHLVLDSEVDQTVPFLAQATIIEIAVEREERWQAELMQKRD